MKRAFLFISLGMIVVGFILARVGDSLSTVNKSGVVQDSALMPVGAIMVVLGFLILLVTTLCYLIGFLKNKTKKDTIEE